MEMNIFQNTIFRILPCDTAGFWAPGNTLLFRSEHMLPDHLLSICYRAFQYPCKFGVLLALLTGLRIGEVCALKWEDISLENKVIFVRHTMQRLKNLNPASEERTRIITGVPKSGRSVRIIPMNQDIEKLCNKWRAEDRKSVV